MDPNTRSCSSRTDRAKTLKNRFYQVRTAPVSAPRSPGPRRPPRCQGGGRMGGRMHGVRAARARHRRGPLIAARFWDADDMRALHLMTEAAHAHGALAGLELHHSGNHAENTSRGTHARAESDGLGSAPPRRGQAMELSTSARAGRLGRGGQARRDCGFDIVYVYGCTRTADAVPLALLQQADRRLRRLAAGRARSGSRRSRR